jgi:hypothetical protein
MDTRNKLIQGIAARIDDLAFLTGDWETEIWDGYFEEHWLPPANGCMQGMSRHCVSDELPFMEYASIEPDGEGLIMWMIIGRPALGEKKPIPFRLIECKDNYAVFFNLENPYPSKMIYSSSQNGVLTCRIEGEENGEKAFDEFKFRPIN